MMIIGGKIESSPFKSEKRGDKTTDGSANPHIQRSASNFLDSRRERRKFNQNFESSTAA
jgi:hypothetical protein